MKRGVVAQASRFDRWRCKGNQSTASLRTGAHMQKYAMEGLSITYIYLFS